MSVMLFAWKIGGGAFSGFLGGKAASATRLVRVPGAYQYALAGFCRSLRPVGRVAAHDTDSEGLCDVFSDRQQLRHWFEWLALIILVKASNDHPLSLIGKGFRDLDESHIEKLTFVDPDNLGKPGKLKDLAGTLHSC
jgi:hypothetical protein